jgi:uncharacterized SAM-binding protein YcdF (DUF218 family)
VALDALTGLGKLSDLMLPLAPLVALTGAAIALTRLRALLWGAALLSFVAVGLVAFTPVTTRLLDVGRLARHDPLGTARLAAVVVLSSGITADSLLDADALDRLLTGLELMHDNAASTLVVTRPRRPHSGVTAARDQEQLRALVGGSFPMLVVDSVKSTRDEAVNAYRLLASRGLTNIAVVTSPLHARRACASFERVGFAVTCIPAESRSYSVRHPASPRERMALFHDWLYEHAAWMEYAARGWVR